MINCNNGLTHVCEVQVHLTEIVVHTQKNHGSMNIFENFLTEAVQNRGIWRHYKEFMNVLTSNISSNWL